VISASGYSLHIFCDGPACVNDWARRKEWMYAGPNKPDVMRQVRADGWLLKRDGKTYCLQCK
jgi:hypothetical protein